MKGYRKYFGKKILWFFITLVAAVILNFILPRLMPADPVSAITGKMASGMTDASAVQEICGARSVGAKAGANARSPVAARAISVFFIMNCAGYYYYSH